MHVTQIISEIRDIGLLYSFIGQGHMFKLLSIDIGSNLFSLLRYFGHMSHISIKIFRNSTLIE